MTKTFLNLRVRMSHKFRIAPIKPISNKFTKIATLIEPFATSKQMVKVMMIH
ncbi:hypothetical protein [Borrelia turicatae]|uniref:hypothetical protein n=1 Tax=Borrelia turicatae TaxID=142 RepID=UPI0013747ED6|nr:hypothetical protein [Borrelia turicatae]UPA14185.1 hypothetical protein bt91E135_001364 [Borrelia turicatae 91E135]